MWAPFALWKDQKTALMFYAHGEGRGENINFHLRVLESSDPRLESWQPLTDRRLANGNTLFAEKAGRDPMVLWDEKLHRYLMYYVASTGSEDSEASNIVRVRQSDDLILWSEPRTLMTTPPGYKAAESVFVLKSDRYYFLWVCGHDYGRMSLYISENPLDFGHPLHNRIMEQSGHSPEIVRENGQYWMACVAIASAFGNAPAVHDLPGVYIQPLDWIELDDASLQKIVRVS